MPRRRPDTPEPVALPSKMLTADDVADLLSVTPQWVYAQARAEAIPHHRLNRKVRFDPAVLAKWVRDQRAA